MPFKNPAEHSAYQNARQQSLRQDWLSANGPCACGSSDDLQVDHTDPALKVSHRIWSWSKDRREKELSKCRPMCRACHEKKSADEKRTPTIHGTISGYRHRGCRCDECRQAHRENRNIPGAGLEPATSRL